MAVLWPILMELGRTLLILLAIMVVMQLLRGPVFWRWSEKKPRPSRVNVAELCARLEYFFGIRRTQRICDSAFSTEALAIIDILKKCRGKVAGMLLGIARSALLQGAFPQVLPEGSRAYAIMAQAIGHVCEQVERQSR